MNTTKTNNLPRAITGDRPTGKLHLGHYVGSLKNRVALQETHNLTVLIADTQALTDGAGRGVDVRPFVEELMIDYMAVGLDPNRVRFVLQSHVPELFELTCLMMNLVTVSYLERNPTVRNEIVQRGFARDIPAGFLCYPVSQAADILGLGGGDVPVGDDQLPMIETANLLSDRLNTRLGREALQRARAVLAKTSRLMALDGAGKMSKSAGGVIGLGDSAIDLRQKIHTMFTDPLHIKVSDPGRVEGNVVFAFLDAFDPNVLEVDELKQHYQRGGLGDMALKKRLFEVMNQELTPVREQRLALDTPEQRKRLREVLMEGTRKARVDAQDVCALVREGLGLNY